MLARRSPFVSLCALLFALAAAPCSPAQVEAAASVTVTPQQFRGGGGDPSLPSSETIVKRVDEVNLVFTVRDKRGRFVADLTQPEIQVLDDRHPPESVRYFQQQTDLPLRVGLLVDVSGSVFHRFSLEQKAATIFLRKVLRPHFDSAFVAGFDSSVHMAQELTDDAALLTKAVQSLQPAGETALYDAVRYACHKLTQGNEAVLVRRVIILFTDGMDNRSQAALSEAVETALRDEVVVYAISINAPEAVFNRPGEQALQEMTGATGGRVLPAENNRQAGKAFDSIQRELRSQYALGYKPADLKRDGRYRSIRVSTSRPRKLIVHARQGYYAPTEPEPHSPGP